MAVLNRSARRWAGAALLIFAVSMAIALPVSASPVRQAALAAISSPTDGQTLQGNITISGSATHPDFERYELAYGPDPNPNDAWQAFSGNNQPVDNGTLGLWNTNVVADGTYVIRLRVIRHDSNYNEAFVRGLKVSNQRPVGTPTDIPPQPTFGAEATSEAGDTIIIDLPPTSEPTARANAENGRSISNTTTTGSASNNTSASSNTLGGLIGSACISGLAWTFVAFVLLGAIALSRSQLKHYRRRQRQKLSDADSQSTPPAAA